MGIRARCKGVKSATSWRKAREIRAVIAARRPRRPRIRRQVAMRVIGGRGAGVSGGKARIMSTARRARGSQSRR